MTGTANARWIGTPEDRDEMVRDLAGSDSLAIDTESDSFYHYYEKICLLQLADASGRVWLVDPLVVPDLSSLGPIFASPRVEKVIHGAEYDLSLMKRDFAFEIGPLFDTQIGAQFVGRRAFGLQALLEAELGITLSKSAQRCDWSVRPLAESQVRYAAEDARHLLTLRNHLRDTLRAAGREGWAREECEALATETPPAVRRGPADFRSARGAWRLRPRELAVLRELFLLREGWAREMDRPLFKVVGDETLMRMAERQPLTGRALASFGGLSPALVRRRGEEILEAIRKGKSIPEAECPTFPDRRGKRMSFEMSRRVDRLKGWRADAAARLDLEAGVLLPQRLIERLAIVHPRARTELETVEGLRRWRIQEFGDDLLRALDGR